MTLLKQLNGESFLTLIMEVENIIKPRPITMNLSNNADSNAPYQIFISKRCRSKFSSVLDQFWRRQIKEILKLCHARQKIKTARRNF